LLAWTFKAVRTTVYWQNCEYPQAPANVLGSVAGA